VFCVLIVAALVSPILFPIILAFKPFLLHISRLKWIFVATMAICRFSRNRQGLG